MFPIRTIVFVAVFAAALVAMIAVAVWQIRKERRRENTSQTVEAQKLAEQRTPRGRLHTALVRDADTKAAALSAIQADEAAGRLRSPGPRAIAHRSRVRKVISDLRARGDRTAG